MGGPGIRPALTVAASGVIEVRLKELNQLFDSRDPSPFAEKDLDPKAERYIVDSYREMPGRLVRSLVVYLDQAGEAQEAVVADAIREHFARQARHLRQQLRLLIRRGLVSLGIGIAFLAAVFGISTAVSGVMKGHPLAPLFEQGLLIVGWVAMWRPLEIFLYDWWPVAGERRMHERLSGIEVRLVPDKGVRSPAAP
jgi:hypothetical protein